MTTDTGNTQKDTLPKEEQSATGKEQSPTLPELTKEQVDHLFSERQRKFGFSVF